MKQRILVAVVGIPLLLAVLCPASGLDLSGRLFRIYAEHIRLFAGV